MKFGIIGLGRIGANLARRALERGHQVVGFNRSPEKTRALEREGVDPAGSIEELAAGQLRKVPGNVGYGKPILLLAIGSAMVIAAAALSRPASPRSWGTVTLPSPDGAGPDRLTLDTIPPTAPVGVPWLEGRATQPSGKGEARLALHGAAGVLSIDARLPVTRPALGADVRSMPISGSPDWNVLTDSVKQTWRSFRIARVRRCPPGCGLTGSGCIG